MRAAFFLWLSVVNLVALSAMWARLADVFGSAASKRLFGFLGAGATCGDGPVLHSRNAYSKHVCCSQPAAAMMCSQLSRASSGSCLLMVLQSEDGWLN